MQVQQRSPGVYDGYDGPVLAHGPAIERVIQAMHEGLCEPLSLEDMADIAYLSPYYFNRVFHRLVGIPPGEFFATLRLNAAKRLLLTTSLSVTEVCFELGYSSLGSFTTRFTQLVGLPPRQLRSSAENFTPPSLEPLSEPSRAIHYAASKRCLIGYLSVPPTFVGLIYVGLFTKPIPQGLPIRCTVQSVGGQFHIAGVPDGSYYALAAALPASSNTHQLHRSSDEGLLVGTGQGLVLVQNGEVFGQVDILLHPPRLTDPPLILALPYI